MKTALLTYTGMENGKIRTVFSGILHFKKPAHRSRGSGVCLGDRHKLHAHARDFSLAAALPILPTWPRLRAIRWLILIKFGQ